MLKIGSSFEEKQYQAKQLVSKTRWKRKSSHFRIGGIWKLSLGGDDIW